MADKDNLPATTTARDMPPVVPSQSGSLMARGLAAINARLSASVSISVDPEEQFDAAAAAWKRRHTTEAIRLATMAAEQGHHRAQELLGAIYSLCPEDRIRNYVQAYVWYHVAIEHMAGTDYRWVIGDVTESRDWVARLLPPLQFAKAQQLAADWAPKHSDDPGTPATQYAIAEAYSEGKGLIQNSSLAMKWWLKAAEQGSGAAQHQLGIAFANGIGVPRDLLAAHAWFSIAWESDSSVPPKTFFSPSSDECRNDIEHLLTPEQLAQARRRADEWMGGHGKHLTS